MSLSREKSFPLRVYPSLAWLKLLKFRAVSSRTAVESSRPSVSSKRYFPYLSSHFSRNEKNPCNYCDVHLLKMKQFYREGGREGAKNSFARKAENYSFRGRKIRRSGWSLSLQWRHDTWNAFTVLFKGDAIKQYEPLKSLGNTKCFQSVALESRILNEQVKR